MPAPARVRRARAPRAVVLGAGAAGLAAARALEAHGCRAVVLEARARAGGRVLTVGAGAGGAASFAAASQRGAHLRAPGGGGGAYADLGAGVLRRCGPDNLLWEWAQRERIGVPAAPGRGIAGGSECAAWFDDRGRRVPQRTVVRLHRVADAARRYVAGAARAADEPAASLAEVFDAALLHVTGAAGVALDARDWAVLRKIISLECAPAAPLADQALVQMKDEVDDRTAHFQLGMPFLEDDPPVSGEIPVLDEDVIGKEACVLDDALRRTKPRVSKLTSHAEAGDRVLVEGFAPFLVDRLKQGLDIRLETVVKRVSVNPRKAPCENRNSDCSGPASGSESDSSSVMCMAPPSSDEGMLVVETARGTKIPCDYVICTLPLGVLQNKDERSAVAFSPPLSDGKRGAIDEFGMGVLNKVVLRFKKKDVFWPCNVPQLNCTDSRFHFFNGASCGQEGVIVATIVSGTEFAKGYSQMSDEKVVEEVLAVLHKAFCGSGFWTTRVPVAHTTTPATPSRACPPPTRGDVPSQVCSPVTPEGQPFVRPKRRRDSADVGSPVTPAENAPALSAKKMVFRDIIEPVASSLSDPCSRSVSRTDLDDSSQMRRSETKSLRVPFGLRNRGKTLGNNTQSSEHRGRTGEQATANAAPIPFGRRRRLARRRTDRPWPSGCSSASKGNSQSATSGTPSHQGPSSESACVNREFMLRLDLSMAGRARSQTQIPPGACQGRIDAKSAFNCNMRAPVEKERTNPDMSKSVRLPQPCFSMVTRWDTDPFSLGSHSYVPCGADMGFIQRLAQPEEMGTGRPVLFFGGEHTSKNGWRRVDGAFESGLVAAHGILSREKLVSVDCTLSDLTKKISGKVKSNRSPRRRPRRRMCLSDEEARISALCRDFSDVPGHFFDVLDEVVFRFHTPDDDESDLSEPVVVVTSKNRAFLRKVLWKRIHKLGLHGDASAARFLQIRHHAACKDAGRPGVKLTFASRRKKERAVGMTSEDLCEYEEALIELVENMKVFSLMSATREFAKRVYNDCGGILPIDEIQDWVKEHRNFKCEHLPDFRPEDLECKAKKKKAARLMALEVLEPLTMDFFDSVPSPAYGQKVRAKRSTKASKRPRGRQERMMAYPGPRKSGAPRLAPHRGRFRSGLGASVPVIDLVSSDEEPGAAPSYDGAWSDSSGDGIPSGGSDSSDLCGLGEELCTSDSGRERRQRARRRRRFCPSSAPSSARPSAPVARAAGSMREETARRGHGPHGRYERGSEEESAAEMDAGAPLAADDDSSEDADSDYVADSSDDSDQARHTPPQKIRRPNLLCPLNEGRDWRGRRRPPGGGP